MGLITYSGYCLPTSPVDTPIELIHRPRNMYNSNEVFLLNCAQIGSKNILSLVAQIATLGTSGNFSGSFVLLYRLQQLVVGKHNFNNSKNCSLF